MTTEKTRELEGRNGSLLETGPTRFNHKRKLRKRENFKSGRSCTDLRMTGRAGTKKRGCRRGGEGEKVYWKNPQGPGSGPPIWEKAMAIGFGFMLL